MGKPLPEIEYVSMHHRIRRDLRRRLKHLAVHHERPVTDIVNEAIENWVKDHKDDDEKDFAREVVGGGILEKLRWLRDKKDEGVAFSAACSLHRRDLVDILDHLGGEANLRMSGDRLVTELVRRL